MEFNQYGMRRWEYVLEKAETNGHITEKQLVAIRVAISNLPVIQKAILYNKIALFFEQPNLSLSERKEIMADIRRQTGMLTVLKEVLSGNSEAINHIVKDLMGMV